MPAQDAQHSFARAIQNVIGHPIIQEWIETLRDESPGVCILQQITRARGRIGRSAMPDLRVLQIQRAGFHMN
jgi:hypothetical protein